MNGTKRKRNSLSIVRFFCQTTISDPIIKEISIENEGIHHDGSSSSSSNDHNISEVRNKRANKEEIKMGVAYIYYKKEQWFILNDIVVLFWRYMNNTSFRAKNEDDDDKQFCCPVSIKRFILARSCFQKVSGNTQIRVTKYHYPINSENETSSMMSNVLINKLQRDCNCECEKHKTSIFFVIKNNRMPIRSNPRSFTHLIDFHSVHEIIRVVLNGPVKDLALFFMQYSLLCKNSNNNASNEGTLYKQKKCRNVGRCGLTKRDKENVAASQGWRCASCNTMFTSKSRYEVDHIVPLYLGGRTMDKFNLQALCSLCHSKKTDIDRTYPLVVTNYRF